MKNQQRTIARLKTWEPVKRIKRNNLENQGIEQRGSIYRSRKRREVYEFERIVSENLAAITNRREVLSD